MSELSRPPLEGEMRIRAIRNPESTPRRTSSYSGPEMSNWKSAARKMVGNHEALKMFATGMIMLAVLSTMAVFVQYSNDQIGELKSKMKMSEKRWTKQSSELESRWKRNAIKIDQIAEDGKHRIAKRSARRLEEGEELPQNEIAQQQLPMKAGTVFTHWGRMDCPQQGPSSLIYHGIAAGTYQGHTGGGADFLCIHRNVTYVEGRFRNGNQGSSYIYGLEYRDTAWVNPLFDLSDTRDGSFQYHSVPCALCMAGGRHGQVMIPGMTECPTGWIHEYDGYIMGAGHSDKSSAQYICVDKRPQVIPGTQGSQGGSYLFMAETQCTSLLCEPIVVGRELTCVVCTM